MSLVVSFMVYATLFKLAVIAAGVFCIYLGFRLFPKSQAELKNGINTQINASKTTANTEIAGFKLSFQSTAPGTAFAGFGVMLLCVMVFTGSPELTIPKSFSTNEDNPDFLAGLRLKGNAQSDQIYIPDNSELESLTIKARNAIAKGEHELGGLIFSQHMALFDHLIRIKKLPQAEFVANQAFSIYSYPLNNQADKQLKNNLLDEALISARLAVRLSPHIQEIQNTFNKVKAHK